MKKASPSLPLKEVSVGIFWDTTSVQPVDCKLEQGRYQSFTHTQPLEDIELRIRKNLQPVDSGKEVLITGVRKEEDDEVKFYFSSDTTLGELLDSLEIGNCPKFYLHCSARCKTDNVWARFRRRGPLLQFHEDLMLTITVDWAPGCFDEEAIKAVFSRKPFLMEVDKTFPCLFLEKNLRRTFKPKNPTESLLIVVLTEFEDDDEESCTCSDSSYFYGFQSPKEMRLTRSTAVYCVGLGPDQNFRYGPGDDDKSWNDFKDEGETRFGESFAEYLSLFSTEAMSMRGDSDNEDWFWDFFDKNFPVVDDWRCGGFLPNPHHHDEDWEENWEKERKKWSNEKLVTAAVNSILEGVSNFNKKKREAQFQSMKKRREKVRQKREEGISVIVPKEENMKTLENIVERIEGKKMTKQSKKKNKGQTPNTFRAEGPSGTTYDGNCGRDSKKCSGGEIILPGEEKIIKYLEKKKAKNATLVEKEYVPIEKNTAEPKSKKSSCSIDLKIKEKHHLETVIKDRLRVMDEKKIEVNKMLEPNKSELKDLNTSIERLEENKTSVDSEINQVNKELNELNAQIGMLENKKDCLIKNSQSIKLNIRSMSKDRDATKKLIDEKLSEAKLKHEEAEGEIKDLRQKLQELDVACQETARVPALQMPSSNPQKEWLEFLDRQIADKERELECPVCWEICSAPIFRCEEDHLICSSCQPLVSSCPECRRPYSSSTGRRHRFAEKNAEDLKTLKIQREKIVDQ